MRVPQLVSLWLNQLTLILISSVRNRDGMNIGNSVRRFSGHFGGGFSEGGGGRVGAYGEHQLTLQ